MGGCPFCMWSLMHDPYLYFLEYGSFRYLTEQFETKVNRIESRYLAVRAYKIADNTIVYTCNTHFQQS